MGMSTINFEKAIAKKLNITHENVALVSNCTTGLHLSMIVTGIKQNHEVLCPSLTFVADANCIKYVGARPQFIDISSNKNWNMSVNDIKKKIRHRKADLVYFDADYYSSTLDALKFIKPYLTNRSILYFDNIFAYSGNPSKGELGAIKDFNRVNKSCGIVKYPMLDQNSNRVYIFYDNSLRDLM